MKKYIKFWAGATVEILFYACFAAFVFLISSSVFNDSDFLIKRPDICMGIIFTLLMFASGYTRKNYKIQLSISLGATRKNTACAYLCSEIFLIIICSTVVAILSSMDMKEKGIVIVSWIVIGAAAGQALGEPEDGNKIRKVLIAVGILAMFLALVIFAIMHQRNTNKPIIPMVIFAIVYYIAMTWITVRNIKKFEVTI